MDPSTLAAIAEQQRMSLISRHSIADICKISQTLREAPTKPPEIIERDSKRVQERHSWSARIEMVQAAFETANLYSLSIIPTCPRELQTLLISKYRAPEEVAEDTSTITECRTSAFLQTPPKVSGLLKPWNDYNSATFGVDVSMTSITPLLLKEVKDIPSDLPEKIEVILGKFLLDPQSKAIGIIMIEAGRASYHVYQKELLSPSASL